MRVEKMASEQVNRLGRGAGALKLLAKDDAAHFGAAMLGANAHQAQRAGDFVRRQVANGKRDPTKALFRAP